MPLDIVRSIHIACQWRNCDHINDSLQDVYSHIKDHIPQLEIVEDADGEESYKCLWLDCIFQSQDTGEIIWHVKYHAYLSLLKTQGDAIAKNRDLPPCMLSSAESNTVPNRTMPVVCQWNSCNESFSGQIEFIQHVGFSHLLFLNTKPKQRVKCLWADCTLTTTKKSKLADHVRMHTGDKAAACSNCGQIFANTTKFVNHRNRQLPITEESPQCSHCLAYLPNERLLKIHMRQHVHHYKCCFCDLTCSTPSILSAHIKYRHLPYKPFRCSSCNHYCKSQNDLNRHMIIHSDNFYTCTQEGCNSKYRTESSLARHFEKEHTESRPLRNFVCHLCAKTYPRGTQLTSHLCSVHKVNKPSGYSRFEYRREKDGYFRLQTTRLESLEVEEMAVLFEDSNQKAALRNSEEDVDDPSPVENIQSTESANGTVVIDVMDDEGKIVTHNVVPTDVALPPEAKVVAVGE